MDLPMNANKRGGRPPIYGKRMAQTALWLPVEMRSWLTRYHPNISEYIRNLVAIEMKADTIHVNIDERYSGQEITTRETYQDDYQELNPEGEFYSTDDGIYEVIDGKNIKIAEAQQ